MERNYLIAHNDVCRRCLGEGFVLEPGFDHGHGHKSEPKEKICDLCNGSGMVRIEKKIEVSITPKTYKPYA
jgi:DnaJ-class molecular chaperone